MVGLGYNNTYQKDFITATNMATSLGEFKHIIYRLREAGIVVYKIINNFFFTTNRLLIVTSLMHFYPIIIINIRN